MHRANFSSNCAIVSTIEFPGICVQLVQESNNLFRLTRFGMINCFLVREDDGLTLIDTSLAGSAPGIWNAAKTLGAPISRIILTHAHIDHVGSLDALVRQFPGIEFAVGRRESRLLVRDFSLDAGETGKKLFGFPGAKPRPKRLLNDGDRVGSLQAIFTPGHTPGHMAYLDVRDGSLIAGDAFTTQTGVVAAGAFKLFFPFPWLFSWNRLYAAESARKLRDLKPARLVVGHGKTVESPFPAMDQAVELAFQQCGKMLD
jgi:glyoxylase-like metal-dependent hydrolase (beta-lactamase superfamily II)